MQTIIHTLITHIILGTDTISLITLSKTATNPVEAVTAAKKTINTKII